ncbi:MAG: hypothetical protein RI988_2699 [Pseudomonadota bacterium]|jgi:hypothetical protein
MIAPGSNLLFDGAAPGLVQALASQLLQEAAALRARGGFEA